MTERSVEERLANLGKAVLEVAESLGYHRMIGGMDRYGRILRLVDSEALEADLRAAWKRAELDSPDETG